MIEKCGKCLLIIMLNFEVIDFRLELHVDVENKILTSMTSKSALIKMLKVENSVCNLLAFIYVYFIVY